VIGRIDNPRQGGTLSPQPVCGALYERSNYGCVHVLLRMMDVDAKLLPAD